MITKEFPDITSKMLHGKNHKIDNNPTYVSSLGLNSNTVNITLAYALARLVESNEIDGNRKFLGANIGIYSEMAKKERALARDIPHHEFLDAFVEEFAKRNWIYGIVLPEDNSNRIEKILLSESDMLNFFEESETGYAPDKVNRTIFVPTPKYTRHTWKFDYELKDLNNIVDFNNKILK